MMLMEKGQPFVFTGSADAPRSDVRPGTTLEEFLTVPKAKIVMNESMLRISIIGTPDTWGSNADGTLWWRYDSSGNLVRDKWYKVGGYWYHFDANGYMQTGWFLDSDGKYYYLLESGGGMGAMQTQWYKVNTTWYYFGSDGAMRGPGVEYSIPISNGSSILRPHYFNRYGSWESFSNFISSDGLIYVSQGRLNDSHQGLDLLYSTQDRNDTMGQPIYAGVSGNVERVLVGNSSMGNAVIIRTTISGASTTNYLVARYMHMRDTPLVSQNSTVTPTTLLGYVGNTGDVRPRPDIVGPTGNKAGSHLHFDINEHNITTGGLSYSQSLEPLAFFPTVEFTGNVVWNP